MGTVVGVIVKGVGLIWSDLGAHAVARGLDLVMVMSVGIVMVDGSAAKDCGGTGLAISMGTVAKLKEILELNSRDKAKGVAM